MRCPVSKFVMHTVSHFVFLFLLAVATFGLEAAILPDIPIVQGQESLEYELEEPQGEAEKRFLESLRPTRIKVTSIQIVIICWIIGVVFNLDWSHNITESSSFAGLVWIECKQIYSSGAKKHFMQYYNYMDFALLALYLCSYTLRFVAMKRIIEADDYFQAGQTLKRNKHDIDDAIKEVKRYLEAPANSSYAYFMSGSRFVWSPQDPEIVSDILFAVANILSFARTTYVMPSHELLGPLQISLGRMIGDIIRFMVLFAFMVGMTNLYHYYGKFIGQTDGKVLSATDTFKGMPETVHTLFFSIFGLIALDKLKIRTPEDESLSDEDTSTFMVDRVGQIMFAIYQVTVTIVLVNMLIAMMSHSFEAIQGDNDVEWKFARTKLWMSYIDESSTLPVPFNMIPTPKTVRYAFKFIKDILWDEEPIEPIKYDFSKRRGNILPSDMDPISSRILLKQKTTYSDILQRLVRRYLFKQDREKYEGERGETVTREYPQGDDEEYDELKAIREEEQLEADKNILSPPPVVNVNHLSPDSAETSSLKSSNSSDTVRQIARRATMRRSTRRRSLQTRPPSAQLDAIQRGQKVLDARLQDLQCIGRSDDQTVAENITHIRHVMAENQKAMGSLVKAMSSTQEEMRSMSNILGSLYNAVSKGNALSSHVKQLKQEDRVGSEDRPHTPTTPGVGLEVPQHPVKKKLHNLRVSIRRPRLKSSEKSDDAPSAV
ncbi:hypothetical protein CAPTEDRAFT_220330 [Capitella teleta]|uniref:Ion transport domain-containing protein n=1 Tax=Capitella teleta TaxID=283909 RepID=R7TWZ8_CAPTE|nr:hypothetical protein CAPTEDRAFT_220330 [Capitella teleta]|eukprot:ELT98254.1 hypothetical protein CAPTEDRAFT_220330 [Capitella teleta]